MIFIFDRLEGQKGEAKYMLSDLSSLWEIASGSLEDGGYPLWWW